MLQKLDLFHAQTKSRKTTSEFSLLATAQPHHCTTCESQSESTVEFCFVGFCPYAIVHFNTNFLPFVTDPNEMGRRQCG